MENRTVAVTFLPSETTICARAGDTVLDAALEHGVEIAHECGGNCACTTCHIRVEGGADHLSPMEEVEDDRLASAENRTSQSRLACQALLVDGAVTVTPMESW